MRGIHLHRLSNRCYDRALRLKGTALDTKCPRLKRILLDMARAAEETARQVEMLQTNQALFCAAVDDAKRQLAITRHGPAPSTAPEALDDAA